MSEPIHHRRSIRISEYDYSQPGAYFITICTWQKHPLFGEIVNGEMKLNFGGQIVENQIAKIPNWFSHIEINSFVVVPDHVHMIIEIITHDRCRGTADAGVDKLQGLTRHAPTEQFGHPIPGSIPTIIRTFKSSISYNLHLTRDFRNTPIWQRNYYEHIIRTQPEWEQIHIYIVSNPANWLNDDQYE